MNESGPYRATVTELALRLESWFKRNALLQGAEISGEISGLKETTGGHFVFTLKDRGATLSCFVYGNKMAKMPKIRDGDAVVTIGNIELRGEYSSYQMMVESIKPTGIGELFTRFEALKEKFRLEGLFDASRKRELPRFVRRVALITSRKSDGVEDFLQTMRSKVPFVEVQLLETRVQGTGAEIEIRDAFDRADRLNFDVVVLTRGGGSYEDRFTFNEEVVVRAIARSKHPVVTAIGHEQDHHLADAVADAVFGTPSKAAEALMLPWISVAQRLEQAKRRLGGGIESLLGRIAQRISLRGERLESIVRARTGAAQNRLHSLERRLNTQSPAQKLAQRSTRLATLQSRLTPVWAYYFSRKRSAVELASSQLNGLDPNAPLARGYALIQRDGRLVRNASELKVGEIFTAQLGRGGLDARVEMVRDE